MKCPFCNEEMKEGFVSTMTRSAICWTREKVQWDSATNDDEFVALTETNPLTTVSIPAFRCDKCGKIIFDYEKHEFEKK